MSQPLETHDVYAEDHCYTPGTYEQELALYLAELESK